MLSEPLLGVEMTECRLKEHELGLGDSESIVRLPVRAESSRMQCDIDNLSICLKYALQALKDENIEYAYECVCKEI